MALAVCLLLAACTPFKFVADYSSDAEKRITDASAASIALYDRMNEKKAAAPTAPLPYTDFSEEWGKIETQLRVMVLREQARPLNKDSLRIAESILRLWQKFREAHRASQDYPLAKLRIDLNHLVRNYAAALMAEEGKKLANADGPPA